jgi:flagellar FliL protein
MIMAAEETPAEEPPKKKSKLPLIIGVVLALVFGGGGFYATWSGMLIGDHTASVEGHGDTVTPGSLPDITFVPVDPVVISLGTAVGATHLRFTAQLEVNSKSKDEVAMLMPRILDVLNGYLRAVEVAQLRDPSALVRLRAQMLRRVQIVTGEGRVRDLLITEFVLS